MELVRTDTDDIKWTTTVDDEDNITHDNTPTPLISIDSILGTYDINTIVNAVNPAVLIKTKPLFLDTNNLLYGDGFSWLLTSDVKRAEKPFMFSEEPIKNIVGIQIGGFRIPKSQTTITKNYLWTVFIKELSGYSFLAGTKKFHFMSSGWTNAWNDGVRYFVELDPTPYNKGMYWFDKPITNLDSITLSFGNPFDTIDMPLCIYKTPVYYDAGEPFTCLLYDTVDVAFDLTGTFKIFVNGFTTSDPEGDAALINFINTTEHTATYTTVTIGLDVVNCFQVASILSGTYGLPPVDADLNVIPNIVTVYVDLYRMIIPLNIFYIPNYNTINKYERY